MAYLVCQDERVLDRKRLTVARAPVGMTPAMAAGLEDHQWSIEELVGLLEERESLAHAQV